MVGAKGRSSHLSLELSGPATCITGKTPIGMASSTLQSNTKMWRDQHHCVTITQKLLYKEKVYTAATNKWLGEKISNLKSFINKQIQRLIQPPYFWPLNRFLWVLWVGAIISSCMTDISWWKSVSLSWTCATHQYCVVHSGLPSFLPHP